MPAYPPTVAPSTSAPSFTAVGLTGATNQATVLAGGTASAAPTTGAHAVGELVVDAVGVAWYCTVAGTPGSWVSVGQRHKSFSRTAGDLSLNSTTWANLPTIGTTWDATLTAAVGDDIECGLSAWMSASGGTAYACLDVASIVSGSPVNSWGAAGNNTDFGVQAWLGAKNADHSKSGSVMRTLVSGDLSAGTVTLRLRYRTSAVDTKILGASTLQPLHFWVKNLSLAA